MTSILERKVQIETFQRQLKLWRMCILKSHTHFLQAYGRIVYLICNKYVPKFYTYWYVAMWFSVKRRERKYKSHAVPRFACVVVWVEGVCFSALPVTARPHPLSLRFPLVIVPDLKSESALFPCPCSICGYCMGRHSSLWKPFLGYWTSAVFWEQTLTNRVGQDSGLLSWRRHVSEVHHIGSVLARAAVMKQGWLSSPGQCRIGGQASPPAGLGFAPASCGLTVWQTLSMWLHVVMYVVLVAPASKHGEWPLSSPAAVSDLQDKGHLVPEHRDWGGDRGDWWQHRSDGIGRLPAQTRCQSDKHSYRRPLK